MNEKDQLRHDAATECLGAAADAHHLAGCLMVDKPLSVDAVLEAAKQLERAARKLRKLVEGE